MASSSSAAEVLRVGPMLDVKSRDAFAREYMVCACLGKGSVSERRSVMDLLCEWAINDAKTKSASSSWIDYARTVWVGAPELVMNRTEVASPCIMRAASFWGHPSVSMKEIRVATRKMMQSVSRWASPSPPGWRVTPAAVAHMYDTIEAFYMAMQVSLVRPDEDPGRYRVAAFLKWAFPILVVAPALSRIPPRSAGARTSILSRMRMSIEEFGEYVTPLLAACSALVPWMSASLSQSIANVCLQSNLMQKDCVPGSTLRGDTIKVEEWCIDALMMGISTKHSTFWNEIRQMSGNGHNAVVVSRCIIRLLTQSRYVRAYVCWNARQNCPRSQWKEYILMRTYAVMSLHDPECACADAVMSLGSHKLWALYKMLVLDCSAAPSSPYRGVALADATRTANHINFCFTWPGLRRGVLSVEYGWTASLISCIHTLSEQIERVWKQGVCVRQIVERLFPCRGVMDIIMEYAAPPSQAIPNLLRTCLHQVKGLENFVSNDPRFEMAYRALLKSVVLFKPGHAPPLSLYPLCLTKEDVCSLRSIVNERVVLKQVRGLIGC